MEHRHWALLDQLVIETKTSSTNDSLDPYAAVRTEGISDSGKERNDFGNVSYIDSSQLSRFKLPLYLNCREVTFVDEGAKNDLVNSLDKNIRQICKILFLNEFHNCIIDEAEVGDAKRTGNLLIYASRKYDIPERESFFFND